MSGEIIGLKGVKIPDLQETTEVRDSNYMILVDEETGRTYKVKREHIKAQKTSELVDDVGFLRAIPGEYMTESEVKELTDAEIAQIDAEIAQIKELTDAEIAQIREVLNTWETFKNNGGEVGGCLSFKKKVRQIEQEINMRDRTYLQRQNLSNYNGYPTWATVIEDPNDDTNTNGMIFMLGNGVEGDSYRDNYFRPLKMGYGQRNYIGSQNVPWDDIYLRGNSKNTNGYTRLPNGLIMQWGKWVKTATETSSSYTYTINFPTSFPNACLMVVPYASAFSTKGNYPPQCCASVMSDYNVDCFKFKFATTIDIRNELMWIAIGY